MVKVHLLLAAFIGIVANAQQAQLDDCVQTCQAKFALKADATTQSVPPAQSSAAAAAPPPPPPAPVVSPEETIKLVSASKSFKSGLVTLIGNKTVAAKELVAVLAPTQGILRFVPFAMNAKVGDTVTIVLGGNGHTVVQGSALSVCNATKAANAFTKSTMLNITDTFDIKVTTDKPTWIYCGVPTHCQKGMFAVLNAVKASVTGTISAAQWIENNKGKSTELASQLQITIDATKNDPVAAAWGSDFSMAPEHVPVGQGAMQMALNILNTRSTMAEFSALSKIPAANGTTASQPADSAASGQTLASASSSAGRLSGGIAGSLVALALASRF